MAGGRREGEYKDTLADFITWSYFNHLRLNKNKYKNKELVLGFWRRPKPDTVSIQGTEVELLSHCKFIGLQLDHELDHQLDWSSHMEAVSSSFHCSRTAKAI